MLVLFLYHMRDTRGIQCGQGFLLIGISKNERYDEPTVHKLRT